MLRALSVENYALIDRLEMTLGPGLNIVTGETGAGKSILLGALGLLLGTRGEAGVQKDQQRACVVEGVFALDGYGLEGFFEENDLDFEPVGVVRRVISASGKSRAYVNDLPVGLGVLKALGDRLIDIHSQHENLLLRDDGFRISILDAAAGQGALVKRYGEEFYAWRGLLKELAGARAAASEARRDEEWMRHQAEELAALRLGAGEDEALEAEQRELSHTDELREAFGSVAGELGADETGVVARLSALRAAIEKVGGIHSGAAGFAERLAAAHLDMQDLEREAAAEYERVEGNPERLAAVVARLDAIYGLQQKHRAGSVAELLALQAEFEEKLGAIEHSGERVAELEAAARASEASVAALAARISSARRAAAPFVEKSVVGMLQRLGMPETRFVVEISEAAALRANGGDDVRFLFTANGSVAPRPIEKVASGGEISRVMLALKTLSARSAGQPTVIFDEIDAGVSGRVADAMGEVIAELGDHCQVLNITHLPQIAAKRGEHFLVYKEGGATHIRALSEDERVGEIAKMLSGSAVTDAAMRQARELLKIKTMKDPQIILSTVLAIATVAYTVINALMLWESRKVRKQKNTPLLIAFLDYTESKSVLSVHIKNIGEGCAKNVKLNVLKDYNQFKKPDMPLSECKAFKNGLNIFPPQYEQIYYLEWATDIDFQSTDSMIKIEIECQPLTGNKVLKSTYKLPFNQIGGNYSNPPASFIGQIPHYLKEQNSTLTKIKEALLKISAGLKSE